MTQAHAEKMVNNEISNLITNVQEIILSTINEIDAALDDFWSNVSELEGSPPISNTFAKQSRYSARSMLYKNDYILGYNNNNNGNDKEIGFSSLMDATIDDFWSKIGPLDDSPQPSVVTLKKPSRPPPVSLSLYNNEYMKLHAQYGRNFGGILIQAMLRTRK